jgi:hypothetical protein
MHPDDGSTIRGGSCTDAAVVSRADDGTRARRRRVGYAAGVGRFWRMTIASGGHQGERLPLLARRSAKPVGTGGGGREDRG